jgi:hypothetical protein
MICKDPECQCYEVAPGVHIHPPRMSPEFKKWREFWDKKAAERDAEKQKRKELEKKEHGENLTLEPGE